MSSNKAASAAPMSSQMQAVVRLLGGQEERTIAQKLADSNRPTWEQYKKDNHDQLNIEGLDTKQMEDYRKQLDAERESRLARGTNHKSEKSKKSKKKSSKHKKRRRKSREEDEDSETSSSESEDSSDSSSRKRKRHSKKKKRKKKQHHHRQEESSDSSSEDEERRKHKRKKRRKHKKKSSKDNKDGDESDGSHYRLSKFFDQGDSE
jgi:hypothetical protein